nr:protein VAC14 homolog isoform X3 [Ipomoea batatas]
MHSALFSLHRQFVRASDRRRFQPEARSVTGGQASSPLLGFTQNLTGDLQAGHRWIRRRQNKSKLEVGKLFLGGRSATKLWSDKLYENRKNAALEGGLIGLAAATVGLTFEAAQHLEGICQKQNICRVCCLDIFYLRAGEVQISTSTAKETKVTEEELVEA